MRRILLLALLLTLLSGCIAYLKVEGMLGTKDHPFITRDIYSGDGKGGEKK